MQIKTIFLVVLLALNTSMLQGCSEADAGGTASNKFDPSKTSGDDYYRKHKQDAKLRFDYCTKEKIKEKYGALSKELDKYSNYYQAPDVYDAWENMRTQYYDCSAARRYMNGDQASKIMRELNNGRRSGSSF